MKYHLLQFYKCKQVGIPYQNEIHQSLRITRTPRLINNITTTNNNIMSLRDIVHGIALAGIDHTTAWTFHPPMTILRIRAKVEHPNTVEEVRVFVRFLKSTYTEIMNADVVARDPMVELSINPFLARPQHVAEIRQTVRYVKSIDTSEEESNDGEEDEPEQENEGDEDSEITDEFVSNNESNNKRGRNKQQKTENKGKKEKSTRTTKAKTFKVQTLDTAYCAEGDSIGHKEICRHYNNNLRGNHSLPYRDCSSK